MKFEITVFIGGKKVADSELSGYTIRSSAVDKIINDVSDRVQIFENTENTVD
ncbi:MAG: hypothetical protein ACI4QZ_01855 [Eubacteriales bacterium]